MKPLGEVLTTENVLMDGDGGATVWGSITGTLEDQLDLAAALASGPAQASAAWPIGSVFIAAVGTDPATLLGFGTWEPFAAGRVLVGLDATQTEFDVVLETGGEKTHVLTAAEVP